MAFNESDLTLPEGFDNVVRLFPLPNLVLFPGVVHGLHIFEPRYRELMADALAEDDLITMAFINPDWESTGEDPPAISPMVCIGKILSHTEMPDGRYNLFLVGTKRARILNELEVDRPYRMANVSIVEDELEGNFDTSLLRHKIVSEFRELAALQPNWNHEALDQFLDDDLPLSHLIDMIGYASGVEPVDQQSILETPEIAQRGELVIRIMRKQVAQLRAQSKSDKPTFPPDFSLN
jgi:Lon protease-like protein